MRRKRSNGWRLNGDGAHASFWTCGARGRGGGDASSASGIWIWILSGSVNGSVSVSVHGVIESDLFLVAATGRSRFVFVKASRDAERQVT